MYVNPNALVNLVFSSKPRDFCFFNIKLTDSNVNMFPYLITIFINGAKKIFGDDISAESMTLEQFNIMKQYMYSLGYDTMYRYDDTQVHLWFEPIKVLVDCKGHKTIRK